MLTKEDIIRSIQAKHTGLVVNQNWGETGLFYNPEGKLAKGIYLMTFKEHDGDHDKASHLNRDNTYRLNLGVSKETFIRLFGFLPSRPSAGAIVDMDYDFAVLDTIMPHPVYGWMAWICVINPSPETLHTLYPLIEEGYNLAITKYKKKRL